ncbi:glycoside hydrolase family 3 N-terminal domain-containing protein [Solilutibacter silvestris]|uniref:beta-glucosidase n=1 Tax=Solilutibacter silvestris TaxID=1645665 RepID=A0A2K1PZK9_9GAMM|nr:glycoside hydrolase family 3 N-terminal domain-containing protein [Lysobacter silvestris]PNS08219.1 Glycosyl hydrolase [Lysobacter silvestris]
MHSSIRRLSLITALTALLHPAYASAADCSAASPRIRNLMARMTAAEKLGQLNQLARQAIATGAAGSQGQAGGDEVIAAGGVGSFLGVRGVADTRRLQEIAVTRSRLKIPLLFADDVIHGYRTIFPVPLAEAGSFDPELAERSARIAAVEASASGIHWTYAPMVDIARDPRWGRVVEGSGEDPYLGSMMAAARVRGFQGRDLSAHDSVLATAKHFVGYGAAEGGRDYNIASMSPQTLQDVYLPPFKAAVDAGVGSIMAAFNELDGTPMHANGALINGLLRKQWGWNGVVVSDYTGVMELMNHGVAGNRGDAGERALRAGVDVDMISEIYSKELPQRVASGRLPLAVVDASVQRVLVAKCRLGLFDDPYRGADPARERASILTPEHRQVARVAAGRSIVLLKNARDVLPLRKDIGEVAVIGPLADQPWAMVGNWPGAGKPEDAVTPLAALRNTLGEKRVVYARGSELIGDDRSGFAAAVKAARDSDVVLLFVGESPEMSAEAASRTSLDLPGNQQALADALVATGKPVVAVLLNGRPLSVGKLAEETSALVEAWFPGIEGGNAISDILFGDVNPAARLAITFPRNVGQVPIYYAHKMTGRPPRAEEKYTSKYIDAPWTPLFSFGYGLSYTTFGYDKLRIASPRITANGRQKVTVTVTNTGTRAGDEVVQLYLRDEVASVTRPVRQLRGFRRIHLAVGESGAITFELGREDYAFHDAGMRKVVEPGRFSVFVGGSSEATLSGSFEVIAQH